MTSPQGITRDYGKSYLIVLFCFLLLYGLTCAPGSLWQDSGEFHHRIWYNTIDYYGSLVRGHPLYILICLLTKSIPWGNFAGKINLVSALFGAVTVANIFLLTNFLTKNRISAWCASLSLGLAWTFWQHAAIAEVYTLYTATLSAELIFLFLYLSTYKKCYLYFLFFFSGLSIANHILGAFPLLCYFLLSLHLMYNGKITSKNLFLCYLVWCIGSSPYLFFIFKHLVQSGDLLGTIKSATVGNFQGQITNVKITWRIMAENIGFVLYNFCSPAIVMLIVGISSYKKLSAPKLFNLIVIILFWVFLIFAARYNVPDRYSFFIPFYIITSIFIGLGCQVILTDWSIFSAKTHRNIILSLLIFCPLFFYWQTPIQLEKIKFPLGTKREIPYRNDYVYFLRPWQHTTVQPQKFAEDSFKISAKNSAILVDGVAFFPLWLDQVQNNNRLDVKLLLESDPKETIIGFADRGLLYVVSPIKDYCPQFLLDNYDFVKIGPLYHVQPKTSSPQK